MVIALLRAAYLDTTKDWFNYYQPNKESNFFSSGGWGSTLAYMIGDYLKIKTHALLLLVSGGAFLYGVRTPEINRYVERLLSKDLVSPSGMQVGEIPPAMGDGGNDSEVVVADPVGSMNNLQTPPSNGETITRGNPPADLSSALDSVRRPEDYTPPSIPMNSIEMAPEGGPVAQVYQAPTFRDLPGSVDGEEGSAEVEDEDVVGEDEALDESADVTDEELGDEPVDDEGL